MRAAPGIAWLAALALGAGCFGGNAERTEGYACGANKGVCAEGLRCQYGACRRPCARDGDCDGACIATLHQLEPSYCTLDGPASCTGDDECGEGEVCAAWDHDHLEERRCSLGTTVPCADGGRCPAGTTCTPFPHDGLSRVCTIPQDVGCGDGCPDASYLLCSGGPDTGVCREGCDVRRPCAEGYECVDDACVEKR